MKIKWIVERRNVVGLKRTVDRGEIVDAPERVAKALIRQGVAESAERTTKKKKSAAPRRNSKKKVSSRRAAAGGVQTSAQSGATEPST